MFFDFKINYLRIHEKNIDQIYFFNHLFVSALGFSQVPPSPPGFECCDAAFNATGDMDAYEKCKEAVKNDPYYCDPVIPIDKSRYIYISMVAAVALASFIIARRMKT